MNKGILLVTLGLLVVASFVSAENHTSDEQMMEDGPADDDAPFNSGPLIALVAVSAVVFVVAKYGP